MLTFDHVLFAAADLDAAAEELFTRLGLGSVVGGRHAGHGTENRIVPLGADYLELVGVADPVEAEASPFGSLIAERARAGGGPAALCLRTDDLDGVARRLGLEPLAMGRNSADGTPLRWRVAGLERIGDGLPFFIEWDVPDAAHPARTPVEHRVAPRGIAWVELGGDADTMRGWLGGDLGGLDLRLVGGPPRPLAVGLDTEAGELALR